MSKKKKKTGGTQQNQNRNQKIAPVAQNQKPKQAPKRKLTKGEYIQILVFSFAIAAIAFTLYNVTVSYDLVYCDDNIFIQNFYNFNKDPANVITSFKKTVGTSYYRPILNVSLIYDTVRGTIDPATGYIAAHYYRATNLILHITACFLIFLFLIKLGYPVLMSFLFGALMAVHPILTPATAWISGRNDSLIAICMVLTFLTFIYFFEIKSAWRWLLFPVHLFFFIMSLFTKEISFVMPAVALSYLIFFKKEKKIFTQTNVIFTIGYIIIGIIWLNMRAAALEGIQNPDTIGIGPIFINFPTLPAMIGKIFLPVKMIALPSFEAFSIISGTIFILAIIAFLVLSKKIDKKKAMFGVLWFSLFLFPSFLVRIVYVDDFFDYAEHRAYLPMIGILVILIEMLRGYNINFNLKDFWQDKKLQIKKMLPVGIAILILVVLSLRSYAYQKHFKDRTAFWSLMVDLYPYKSRGYLDLGKAYFAKEDLKTAEKLYHMGIDRNPNNKNLYIDLSVIYLKEGKIDKALQYAQTALNIDPKDAIANYNYGKASYIMGRYDDAVTAYEKACRGNNTISQWFVDLGVSYYVTRQTQKSLQAYEAALQLDPNNALAFSDMGASYAVMGNVKDAEQCWLKAISIEPRIYDAYLNLIRYYMSLGQLDRARSFAARLKESGGNVPTELQNVLGNF